MLGVEKGTFVFFLIGIFRIEGLPLTAYDSNHADSCRPQHRNDRRKQEKNGPPGGVASTFRPKVAGLEVQLYYLQNLVLRHYGTNEIYEEWGTHKQLAAGADSKRSHFQQFLFELLFPVKATDPISRASQKQQFEGVYACTQLALGTIPADQFSLLCLKFGLKQPGIRLIGEKD